jgi:hypothetical protein
VSGLAITYAKRSGLTIVVLAMLAMWTYAFFFSPRESVNKIGDTEWTVRAAGICAEAKASLLDLADFRLIQDQADLAKRAEIVRQASAILQAMVSDLESVSPGDDKGRALIPLWLADYRTYLMDRDDYTNELSSGNNVPFSETQVDGIPLSEKIATFANDNRMPECAPPRDLSV